MEREIFQNLINLEWDVLNPKNIRNASKMFKSNFYKKITSQK